MFVALAMVKLFLWMGRILDTTCLIVREVGIVLIWSVLLEDRKKSEYGEVLSVVGTFRA